MEAAKQPPEERGVEILENRNSDVQRQQVQEIP
jgi:hypothetical protein